MLPDAERILSRARSRRVHGAVMAAAIVLLCTFLAWHYGLYAGVFGAYLLGPAVVLILVLASSFQKGDKLVLWLRRFHVRRPAGMQFERLLQGACQGLGFPRVCDFKVRLVPGGTPNNLQTCHSADNSVGR